MIVVFLKASVQAPFSTFVPFLSFACFVINDAKNMMAKHKKNVNQKSMNVIVVVHVVVKFELDSRPIDV